MSHEPPVPAGNQSPYPLREAPHPHPAPLPPTQAVARRDGNASGALGRVPVVGVVVAAGVAVLAGIGALLFSRRSSAATPKPRKRRSPKR